MAQEISAETGGAQDEEGRPSTRDFDASLDARGVRTEVHAAALNDVVAWHLDQIAGAKMVIPAALLDAALDRADQDKAAGRVFNHAETMLLLGGKFDRAALKQGMTFEEIKAVLAKVA